VIQRILLWVSTICTVIVVLSFVLFAVEEAGAGSKTQQNLIEQINTPNPTPQTEQERQLKHSWAREQIDDANDVLVSPFSGVTHSGNIWVQRGVPSLLAFLLYFVLLRILANYAVRLQGRPSLSRT
jgi:hypothetical protein